AGYGYSSAATGPAGEARYGADRAPSTEPARLLDDQRAVPRENRAGGVCDARRAVPGPGLWGWGDPRARRGTEADARLTAIASPGSDRRGPQRAEEVPGLDPGPKYILTALPRQVWY